MFHHFHGTSHIKGQGAISSDQLKQIIEFYGTTRILSADEWMHKLNSNCLTKDDICLTFDDALLCQYDIALPVLQHYNIKAFWFVYTSIIENTIEMLELYRKFRTTHFVHINEFYNEFNNFINNSKYKNRITSQLKNFAPHKYLIESPFYSPEDKKFRFIRDVILGDEPYHNIMSDMIESHNIDIIEFSNNLWLQEKHIKDLHSKGHIIGLHSHSHPTVLSNLTFLQQSQEYIQNYETILNITGEPPCAMSHPCNSYNQDTLQVLKNLNIKIGFRANMNKQPHTNLELPRIDHSIIIKEVLQ